MLLNAVLIILAAVAGVVLAILVVRFSMGPPAPPQSRFRVGDQVVHKTWGTKARLYYRLTLHSSDVPPYVWVAIGGDGAYYWSEGEFVLADHQLTLPMEGIDV